MTCPKCNVKLEVRSTHTATTACKTRVLECPKCHMVATSVEVLVCEATVKGEGAYALAQKIRRTGRLPKLPAP